MGNQIIKQENGKFCVYNTIVDNVIYYNCEERDIVNFFVKEYKRQIKKDIHNIIEKLNNNEKPYYQFTKTFEEMLNWIECVHGKEEVEETIKLINEE